MSNEPVFTFRDAIPRDRSVYTASDHLLRRVRMDGRFITEELVRDLISTGNLVGNRPGKGGWVFEKNYDGVKMKLVCDIGVDLEPRIVTGVSMIVDRKRAIESDRWGKHTVQQVELRSALSNANKVEKSKMKKLECVKPIDVKGHRIITALNWDYVKCMRCGCTTRSKSELAGTPCQ